MVHFPGMGLSLPQIQFWFKRFDREAETPATRATVLQATDRVDELLFDEEALFQDLSQDTGPVKHVHETLERSLESYQGKRKHLERKLADIKEELRQTEVTIRALSQAYNILGTDMGSNGSITLEI